MKGPRIHEIHASAWLTSLTAKHGYTVTLAGVPVTELDALADLGTDFVWMMGVWERSPAARKIAREHPGLLAEYREALPDVSTEDIVGSPYAIYRYSVEPKLGGRYGLAALRRRLSERGIGLLLDFVPNHVAIDHAFLQEAPECLIRGTPDDLAAQGSVFFRGPKGDVFAHGRDPYFPPWTDTAQLNAFGEPYREAARKTLLDIATQCDGVRCDMAMLMTNGVFKRTWQDRAGRAPELSFWRAVLPAVKTAYPNFLTLAEVYWEMEAALLGEGFDYAYDKGLYDRLRGGDAASIRAHLGAPLESQSKLVRFIENHDEIRAQSAFGPERARAAAVFSALLPGASLFHEGQEQGHRVKLPVQLTRRPEEPGDTALASYYRTLRRKAAQDVFRRGTFVLRRAAPVGGLAEHNALIAWSVQLGDERRLVVVNWSDRLAQGRIALPDLGLLGRAFWLHDLSDGARYERHGDEMADPGLHVVLRPWGVHVLSFE